MQQTQHLKRTQNDNMKKINVGNLNKDVTISDLDELFGLKLRVTYKNIAAMNCQ